MTGVMRTKRLLKSWVGLLVGLQLCLLVVGGLFWSPAPAAAVEPSCFLKAECIDLNKAGGGNCDDEHCWEQGGACEGTAGQCYAKWPSQELVVDIGVTKVANLGDYLVKIYDAGFAMAGFLAAVMIVIGGLYVATAGGNDTNVSKGKTIIKNALVGLFIAAGAFVILQTVNPALVKLELPKILVVKKQRLGQCKGIEQCVPCGERFIALLPKNTKDDLGGGLTSSWVNRDCNDPSVQSRILKFGAKMTDALAARYDEGPECVGKSCQLLNSNCKDESHKCVIKPKGGTPADACKSSGTSSGVAMIVCLPDSPGGSGDVVEAGKPCPPGTHPDTGAADTKAPADNNEYYCRECKPNGMSGCTVVAGESDECCSGFCAESIGSVRSTAGLTSGLGTCTNGDFGAPCADDSHCKTGLCNEDWYSGRCVTGLAGSMCSDQGDCKNGHYCAVQVHMCLPGYEHNYCNSDANCKGGLVCKENEFGFKLCVKEGEPWYSCNPDSSEDKCGDDGPQYCTFALKGRCTTGSVGAPCERDNDCAQHKCSGKVCSNSQLGAICNDDGDCGSGQQCVCMSSGILSSTCACTAGSLGSPCEENDDCGPDPRNPSKQLVCRSNSCGIGDVTDGL